MPSLFFQKHSSTLHHFRTDLHAAVVRLYGYCLCQTVALLLRHRLTYSFPENVSKFQNAKSKYLAQMSIRRPQIGCWCQSRHTVSFVEVVIFYPALMKNCLRARKRSLLNSNHLSANAVFRQRLRTALAVQVSINVSLHKWSNDFRADVMLQNLQSSVQSFFQLAE